MRLERIPHFLTLVLLTSAASLSLSTPGQAAPSTEMKPDPVPVFDNRETARLIPSLETSEGSTNLGVGLITGIINKDKETENITLVQLQRTQYNFETTAQEFGLSFTSNGLFGVNWGFKWIPDWGVYGEPWYKVGLWGLYDPRAQLGNFIDYERYWVFGSAGFENLLKLHRQIRIEGGAAAGALGTFVFAQVIYGYPD